MQYSHKKQTHQHMAATGLASATAPLLASALVLGVHPLSWSHGIRSKVEAVYSLCYLGVFCFLALFSVTARGNSIVELLHNGDFIEATMAFVGTAVTLLSCITSIVIIHFITTKGTLVLNIYKEIDTFSKDLNYSIHNLISKYVQMYVIFFWPLYILLSTKEIYLWFDYSVFYSINFDSFIIFLRGSFILLEEELKIIMLAKEHLFHKINTELGLMATQGCRGAATRLERLRRTHGGLCALGESVSTAFEAVLVPDLLMIVIDAVQGYYFGCIGALNKAGSLDGLRLQLTLDSFFWGFLTLTRLLFLTRTCHRTTCQAAQTRHVVHKLELVSRDLNLREEVSLFTTQLLHCGAPCYDVFAMFRLDLTLFASVVGGVSTYMVILLQFHTIRGESCPEI